ncbi:MAG TPA: COR domain-containing protein [Allosphingosinicella sp.]|jgi:Leucine-rich repeat (LRR) protein
MKSADERVEPTADQPTEDYLGRALAVIKQCRDNQDKALSLAGLRLGELPSDLFELYWLESLNISYVGAQKLPPQIGNLTQLVHLNAQGNRFNEIPREIGALRNLEVLDLGRSSITELPPDITGLVSLLEIDLYGNPLRQLPDFFWSLTSIQQLGLTKTSLDTLSEEIGQLNKLQRLFLGFNCLSSLPASISSLVELRGLFLHNNRLADLPDWISSLAMLDEITLGSNGMSNFPTNLASLKSLRRLEFSSNCLRELPRSIGDLSALRTLELQGNELGELPIETENLKELTDLNLSRNSFDRVPPAALRLTSLERLNLSDNQLTAVPDDICALRNLKHIVLTQNEIRSLPASLADLPDLENVELSDNPLPRSYVDALQQGIEAFRALLLSFREATRPLYEAKLLITGEGQVGKSWTLAKLRGADPERVVGSDNTTWGIDRGELRLPHPDVAGEHILLNTWDFGGQKIYRVTHQFFFSQQAIYVLVWNPRQGAEQCRVREWLRMIALRTGSMNRHGGRKRAPRAKVIMVATHAEAEGGSYNPDYGRESLDPDLQAMIVDEAAVDACTGYGIESLRAKIAAHAAQLPDMGQPLNARWAAARDAVLAMRAQRPWISFEQFAEVARAHSVADPDEMRTLVWTYLHSLGRAVWYGSVSQAELEREEPLLADTIVLDAVWLSRAFVQVLDDEDTRSSGGMLRHDRFTEIWTTHGRVGWHCYKPSEYEILKLVMRRFDVALPTRESQGSRSLVPQLVPFHRPTLPWAAAADAPGPRVMRLSCELGYEAIGLVPRLIAATEPWHTYAQGVGLFWEGGMFLRDTASFQNEALLTVSGIERPWINLVVSGEQPAFLLNEIYKAIEGTLKFWTGLPRTYWVNCPTCRSPSDLCSGKFKHEAIVRRVRDQVDAPFVCDDCDAVWKPERLILGFESLVPEREYVLSHFYRRDQIPCPRVFLLEPVDSRLLGVVRWREFVGKKVRLTLLSELSGQKIASEEFTLTKQWVSWLRPLARVASLALTGAALPISGDLANEFSEGASLLDKLADLPGTSNDVPAPLGAQDQHIHIPKRDLVNFKKVLVAVGLDPRDHGMDIALAPDGRWLWMSADEVEVYTPQEAA